MERLQVGKKNFQKIMEAPSLYCCNYLFSYTHTKKEAEEKAHHQQRMNVCLKSDLADLYKREQFDEILKFQ